LALESHSVGQRALLQWWVAVLFNFGFRFIVFNWKASFRFEATEELTLLAAKWDQLKWVYLLNVYHEVLFLWFMFYVLVSDVWAFLCILL
jgi:hypothetical protein